MNIGFTKMHGLGNDFVVIDNMNGRIKLPPEYIADLCDRHRGIGADGVILVEPSDKADCFMNYYNSDGSIAEMCGNGIRCTAKYLRENILKNQYNFRIDTRAGVKEIRTQEDGTYSVNMGKPVFSHADFPDEPLELEGLTLNFVSTGNPHAVAFVDDLDLYDLAVLGPKIENDKNFPNKINFSLVEIISPSELKMKIWERGSGATLSSGSGSCAVYAIIRKYKNGDNEIKITLPGGDLFFSENGEGDIIMRGPAMSVYSGLIEI